ncbi:uncharacterized protein BCR38DRAFT_491002 [Pseudomassariella vexata]|uniref:Uncharacterized protein n=1 Tax=Pseudomassariella vexata TaxID=1141098 RepID=A0A1Y2D907_9PEZI|nr:uncharacterized protein BCR38DRAFT_491002 [Pseudomassariella vexata]ORY55664.1 hypothetical protein BCR38DRAFT_491002 [Pseudomassariella vexata]
MEATLLRLCVRYIVLKEIDASVPDVPDIVKLCSAGSMRLHIWKEQYDRPDCIVTPKTDYSDWRYDPLAVFFIFGTQDAMRKLLQDHDTGSMAFLRESGFRAAE